MFIYYGILIEHSPEHSYTGFELDLDARAGYWNSGPNFDNEQRTAQI